MGFSRQEYWGGLLFSPPRDLPNLGMEPESPTLWAGWFSSVVQSCQTLCDLMDCSMPDFPVHHQFPELAQTHVHRVSDAIQPAHPLSFPSPPAFNLS